MILLIDNYDSFSYNLYQLAASFAEVKVIRNDELTVKEIEALGPSHIILSPGPGHPKDAGVCEQVIRELSGIIPILGVCLGHQAICEVYGARIAHAKQLMHGKQSDIDIDCGISLFKGLPSRIKAARYHSLIAEGKSIPKQLLVTARDAGGEVMAVKHIIHETYGVQFHPESILTPQGEKIIENFLKTGGAKK